MAAFRAGQQTHRVDTTTAWMLRLTRWPPVTAVHLERVALPRQKRFFGCSTGDLIRAVVPTGKHAGTHTGRIAVRTTGKFNIRTSHGLVQGVHHRHVRLLQRADGYAYTTRKEAGAPSPA